jgi:hypothetical protein
MSKRDNLLKSFDFLDPGFVIAQDVLYSWLYYDRSSEDRRRRDTRDPTLRQSKYMETALSYRKADPTKFRSPSLSFEPKRAQLSSEDERKGAYSRTGGGGRDSEVENQEKKILRRRTGSRNLYFFPS